MVKIPYRQQGIIHLIAYAAGTYLKAHENLVRELKEIHNDAVEKKIFSTNYRKIPRTGSGFFAFYVNPYHVPIP